MVTVGHIQPEVREWVRPWEKTVHEMGMIHTKIREAVILMLVFAATLGVYSLNWFQGYGLEINRLFGDVTTVAAERVLAGDIPYRDFWTIYAPGSYYLLALLYTLFGIHVSVGTVAPHPCSLHWRPVPVTSWSMN